MENLNPKFAKGGHNRGLSVDNSIHVKFNQNFTVNLPLTSLKNMDDSLIQPSKNTDFSTNISHNENSHRLPRITNKSNLANLRINSNGGGGAESAQPRTNAMNTSYSSTPFRSTRVPQTSASPYRGAASRQRFKSNKRLNKSFGNGFGPINVQDSKSPTPLDLTEILEKPKITDHGFKMNPKIIESWINETLGDAEHLDIPGVLLKPEHK